MFINDLLIANIIVLVQGGRDIVNLAGLFL